MFRGIGSTMPSPVREKNMSIKNPELFSNYDLCSTFKQASCFCHYCDFFLFGSWKLPNQHTFSALQMKQLYWKLPLFFGLSAGILCTFFVTGPKWKKMCWCDRCNMPVMKTALLLPSGAFSFCNLTTMMKNKKNLSEPVHCDCLPEMLNWHSSYWFLVLLILLH